jgi:transmembrane sensor
MTKQLDSKIRSEADSWFAKRLEPAARTTESEAFERWRQDDPRREQAYADTEKLWQKLALLKQSERLRSATSPSSAWPGYSAIRHHPVIALAASIALVTVVTLLWFDRGVPTQTFTSALGEQRTETLTDGTILTLNTGTTLEVQITDHERLVTLRSGEAAFDVAKDASRLFVVAAGDGTVTAVGTQFQVRHEDGAVEVSLIEGRVRLARPSRHETEWLAPGQQAAFAANSSGIVRRNVDLRLLTRWMSGRLEFRDTPLERAVFEANRYSARKIRIADPQIRDLRVSGTFITGDVDAITRAFEAAFPVRVHSGEQEVTLYRR